MDFNLLDQVREELDYTWHIKENEQEKTNHNKIIKDYLNIFQPISSKNPTICFMAGCFGSGKSHFIKNQLLKPNNNNNNNIPLNNNTILNDPDKIKYMIDSDQPINSRHNEACMISEIITRYGLKKSYNLIVDGSLRDTKWHQEFFLFIKKQYPHYNLWIIYIKTNNFDLIKERVEKRGKQTGRTIDLQILKETFETIPNSVAYLKSFVDCYLEFENNKND